MSQVAEAEEKTAGGLILTEQAKQRPSVGTVCYVIIIFSLYKLLLAAVLLRYVLWFAGANYVCQSWLSFGIRSGWYRLGASKI